MQQRNTHEIDFVRNPNPAPSIEVDADSLQAAWLDIDDILCPVLAQFAEQHPKTKATVYLFGTNSVNFGEQGWSEFLVVAGGEKVLMAIHDAFASHHELKSRVSDYVTLSYSQPRFHIEDGKLWQVLDSASWGLVEVDGGEGDEPPLPDEVDDREEDSKEVSSSDSPAPRRGRLRAARSDASVGTIRQTIEEIFGLPPGSVALCGPDRRPLRADASIGTLRRRWDNT